MKNTSTEFNTIAENPFGAKYIHKIIDLTNNTEIKDDIDDFLYSAMINDDDVFTIGNTCSATISFSITNPTINLNNKEIEVYQGLDINGTVEYVKIGIFRVLKPKNDRNVVEYQCVDRMTYLMNMPYSSDLTFPSTDIKILEEICTQTGIQLIKNGLITHSIKNNPSGYTRREIIAYMSQLQGKNARINSDGNLEIIWYTDANYVIDDNKIYYDGTSDVNSEIDYKVEYLECTVRSLDGTDETVIKAGSGANGIKIENPFMTQTILYELANKLVGFTFRGAEFEFLGDFRLEVGDIVSVETNGEVYRVPIMQIEHRSDGGVVTTITSIGETDTENEIDLSSPNVNAMDRYYAELVLINKAMINKLSVDEADIKYLKVTQLEGIEANIENAVIENLEGKYISAEELDVEKARITVLEANSLTSDSAIIKGLEAGITKTNTLIFGSASGNTIQTEFSNSVIAQLGDAQIESAMIKEISALKITGLDLNTTKFTVHSEDGLSQWKDNTITIHDGVLGTPRIQIGKDGSGDYNMYIWNAQGKLMFDALGLTENGVVRQIIRNDIVKDDANINATKLNIESLFNVINDETSYMLKSSKIWIDSEKQTLDISFKVMSSNVSDLQETQISQGTNIETIQGQISTKIWQQDITTAIDNIEVGGRNLQLGTQCWTDLIRTGDGVTVSNEIISCPQSAFPDCNFIEVNPGDEITVSVDVKCDVEKSQNGVLLWQWYSKDILDEATTNRVSYEYVSADVNTEWKRIISTVTVPDDSDIKYLLVGLRARDAGNMYFKHLKVEKGNKATDWTVAPEDIDAEFVSMTTQYSELLQDLNGFKFTVSNTYTTLNILRNCNKYTEINKLKLTANKDNYFEITDIEVELIKGEQYTFSCDTDGMWGTGTDDTVEAYLLLNGSYETYFRVEDKYSFVAPETGKYILRLDVNKNGCTHYFWNIMLEKGSIATEWKPNLTDLDITSESTKTVATQTADKFNWMVASGTSSSDFTLTDRMAELTAEIISFNGNVKVSGDMLVDGAITAEKLAVDAIKSRNITWEGDDSGWTLILGAILDLQDGSFISPNLSWDKYGKISAKAGEIGKWVILPGGGLMAETITSKPGDINRIYLQPFTKENHEDTWVISSQHEDIDSSGNPSGKAYEYWYITGAGDFYTEGNIGCNTFLANFETAGNILFTKKRFGTSSAGTDYCYWITPCTDSIEYDEAIFYGGYKDASNTEEAYYPLWYITLDGTSGFETVSAGTYNNVSDRNKKHDIVNLNEQQCINVICALNPVSFKFNNTEYQRNHWGFVAQDVESALENLNISWQDFAVVDKTLHKTETMPGEKAQNSEETYDYYLRYEAFIAPIVAVEQNHEKRIQQLENDLAVANALIQSLLIQQSTV